MLAPAIGTAVLVFAFARGLPYPLQATWDDGRFILDNPLVREPSLAHLWEILSRPHFQAYHPLHLLSYWLDVPWSDASAPVLHTTNLVLWIAAAHVLYAAFRALGLSSIAAGIGALAVAVHPVQVEAVVWATGRKDVLAMLGAALTLLFHARSQGMWDRNAWLSRVAFLCACLAKTTVLPLCILLIIVDRALDRRPLRAAVLQQLPIVLVSAGLAPVVFSIWSDSDMIRTTAGTWQAAPMRALASLGHQARTALWPAHTAPMYDTRAINAPDVADYVIAVVCLWGLATRRGPALIAGGGFLVMMAPVANLVPMYFPLQDRYLSLPLIPLALALGIVLDRSPQGVRPFARLAAMAAVLVLAGRTAQYTGVWRSEARLWGHAATTQPQAYYAWMKLGEVRRKGGDLYGAIAAYAHLPRVDPTRKLGYAALLQTVALRDERLGKLSPSRAEEYAKAFYTSLDDPRGLQALAASMLRSGHLRALELPLSFAMGHTRIPDTALAEAARAHFLGGRPSLGLFYLGRMRHASEDPELLALAKDARKRVTPLPLLD